MTQKKQHDSADFADDALIRGAYAIEDAADAKAFYKLWADDYDDHMVEELGYVSPRIVADLLLAHLDGTDKEVLDIGCGTGLTGQPLAEHGIDALDGIDLSDAMLKKAAARGIYRQLMRADLTRTVDLDSGTYDALVSSGTFTHGHVGPEPLGELARLLRPGGLFAFTVHRDIWESAGFAAEIERLRDKGSLDIVEKRLDRFFEPLDPAGWFVLCRRPEGAGPS